MAMKYRFVAYSLEEGIIKGRVEADSEPEAKDDIVQKGYKILRMKQVWQPPGIEDLFPSFFKIKGKDLVRFTQQLAIMVRGGGSLQRALELLEAESNNRVMRGILTSVIKSLDEGGTLSAAMAEHPKVFSPRYVSVVGAGEHTGRLAPSLEQLALILEREHEAKQKVKRTMMMPMFTIGAAIAMLVLMLTTLLPPLLDTFKNFGSEIPLITRIAMGSIGAVTDNMRSIFF